MVKALLFPSLLVLGSSQPLWSQTELNAVLVNALPKASYCDREPSCVVAAGFRLLETINKQLRARDTIWAYITCPENFSPGFWTENATYELHLNGDTSSIRGVPKLSFPLKQPVGLVSSARKIKLR
jgi:hypothetical protein